MSNCSLQYFLSASVKSYSSSKIAKYSSAGLWPKKLRIPVERMKRFITNRRT